MTRAVTALSVENRKGGRSFAARITLLLSALIGVLLLTSLGIWQLERRVWKLDLITRVDQRIHAASMPAPGPQSWPYLNAANDEYHRVKTAGHFLENLETLVKAVTEYGAGYWVLAPFKTDEGFVVFVNRGFISEDRPQSFAKPRKIETTVTGLLRISEPGGAFLRNNDPADNRWYSRDIAAIASARGISQSAPYFIDADATSDKSAPIGGLTVVAFRNNHLVYALTWFSLAAMLALWTAYNFWLEDRTKNRNRRHDSR